MNMRRVRVTLGLGFERYSALFEQLGDIGFDREKASTASRSVSS